jgi:hypothetical protein
MNRRSLDPAQLLLMETILNLGFGRIEQLPIRDGLPCLEQVAQTVLEIKLGSEPEPLQRSNSDLTLKIEFARLFDELTQLGDGLVDIEVKHAVPFRLFVKHSGKELM